MFQFCLLAYNNPSLHTHIGEKQMVSHRSVVAAVLLASTVTAGTAYLRWGRTAPFPDGLIQANGRIEGDSIIVASKFPGRIVRLFAREGATVQEGQTLVRLDDAQTQAKREQAAAELSAALAQEQGAGAGLSLLAGITSAQLHQAQGIVAQAASGILSAQADVNRAKAALDAAHAAARSTRAGTLTAYAAVETAATQQQQAQAGLRVGEAMQETARAALRAAQANLAGLRAASDTAARDAKRYEFLAREGAASPQAADQADAQAKQAKAQWEGAVEQVKAAQAGVEARHAETVERSEQIKAANAGIAQAKAQLEAAQQQEVAARAGVRQAQAQYQAALERVRQEQAQHQQAKGQWEQAHTAPQQLAVSRTQRVQAQARIRQARAALRELDSILHDLTIAVPAAGTITTRFQNIGEVIAAGTPLLEMVDLDRLYVKVYVPEHQIGKLRLGLPARIFTDAFPHQPFAAHVGYIASRAEFTPKEVQTPEERVKQVYAVKLYIDANPDHRLTPGLPADAIIRWKEGTLWAEPRW
jgi:multidrug resistance efflux pump